MPGRSCVPIYNRMISRQSLRFEALCSVGFRSRLRSPYTGHRLGGVPWLVFLGGLAPLRSYPFDILLTNASYSLLRIRINSNARVFFSFHVHDSDVESSSTRRVFFFFFPFLLFFFFFFVEKKIVSTVSVVSLSRGGSRRKNQRSREDLWWGKDEVGRVLPCWNHSATLVGGDQRGQAYHYLSSDSGLTQWICNNTSISFSSGSPGRLFFLCCHTLIHDFSVVTSLTKRRNRIYTNTLVIPRPVPLYRF